MAKPVILSVDDDPQVLSAVSRDLRGRYGKGYRVVRASSGEAALETVRELKSRNDTVALFLVDQRMPIMNGVGFLGEAMPLYPEAKRVLLTAYADTEAAIRAINEVAIHHYLLKPWDPPEEHLYPVLDDLLDDWRASFRPPFEGIRVLGDRWSPLAHTLRDFLARSHVPYRWLDVEAGETNDEVRALLGVMEDDQTFPVVVFPDGSRLTAPSTQALAEHAGLTTQAAESFYDLVIVGGGPAGLAAAVYGASEGLSTLIVERDAPGGQAGQSSRIENYLGFPSGLSGGDLARRAVAQAKRFGVEILAPQAVTGVRVEGPYRIVQLGDGSEVSSQALLIATGVQWRTLEIPGMARLQGAGVYYGAGIAEAIECRGEDVYIVGGANSAGQAAVQFSKYARRVVLLVRGDSLAKSMSRYLIDQIEATENIHVELNSSVTEVHGETRLEAVSVHCTVSGETTRVPATSVYIFIGAVPSTDWLDGVVARDARGFILSGAELLVRGERPQSWTLDRDPGLLEASVPGIFAVGDVRLGSVKRVASGVGEGAIAVQFIHQYLTEVGA